MKKSIIFAVAISFGLIACGGGDKESATEGTSAKAKPQSMIKKDVDPMQDKGIGPVTVVVLDPEINQEMAAQGKEIYDKMCTACHKPTEKFIGPAPKGVLDRRTPEWVMNMILNPDEMVKENAQAKKLLMEFNGSPMANQNLTEEQARDVLEYFRTL
jgi:mono/diheme cytochrome c family protein